MKKHLDKIKKCVKSIDCIGLNDDEINKLSLTKIGDRNKNSNDNEESNKNKCIHCNNKYSNIYTLRRHIDKFCKKKDKKYDENIIENIIEKNIECKNIETNIEHQTNNINNGNILNQTNNVNINIINLPISFETDWNTDHMNKYLKELIIVSDNKYTSLLYKILDNKKNLNVIVDKDIDNGYIFTENEYKNIDKEEIADMSMEKLNKELNKMLEEVLQSDEIFCEKNIETHKNLINDKYSEYIKNISIQKIVQKYIIDIYDATKNVANEYLIEYRKKNKEGF
jgi:hypothetical protein